MTHTDSDPVRLSLRDRPVEKLRLSVTVYPSGLLLVWLTSYMQQSGSYSPPQSVRTTAAFSVDDIGDPAKLLRMAVESLEGL